MSALPLAFRFALRFAGEAAASDLTFREVTGLEEHLQVERVAEGGENRFFHQLPAGNPHPRLTVRWGLAAPGNGLLKWCQGVMESSLAAGPAPTRDLELRLLDANGTPLRQWGITQAYPLRWEVDAFYTRRDEIAIEKIELAYAACKART